jgi:hypothetical protein
MWPSGTYLIDGHAGLEVVHAAEHQIHRPVGHTALLQSRAKVREVFDLQQIDETSRCATERTLVML